jgi:1,4-dihydroxy-2-naphthoate octaprenyltransferase
MVTVTMVAATRGDKRIITNNRPSSTSASCSVLYNDVADSDRGVEDEEDDDKKERHAAAGRMVMETTMMVLLLLYCGAPFLFLLAFTR